MSRELVLLKLGGSILTNKSEAGPPRFRAATARSLCRELARLHRAFDWIVVLGAGSWGHPQAIRHGVGRRALRGAAKTRALDEITGSIADLRDRFCRAASRAGLPVVPIAANRIASAAQGRLDLNAAAVALVAEAGLVPVTGGDVIGDRRLGLRILSGDEILAGLALRLSPARVLFATDVPGILVDGKLQRRWGARERRSTGAAVRRGTDATGGMGGKLAQARRIAASGTDVEIFDGREPSLLARAAQGENVGTRLTG